MIELKSVTKRFKDLVAVNNLDLFIGKGTLFGFLGPNGAGKTTTIKMIVGLLKPTQGSIFINGLDITTNEKKAKSMIGYIPDRPYLYEKLSAQEFVRFTSSLYNLSIDSKFQSKMDSLLDRFSLLEWKDELIENFSHGMKQRLIMVSVLIREPEIIIVDEPMVGLDPIAIKLVKDIFRDIVNKGRTIFMSTHSIHLAQEICTDIGVINKGKLILKGRNPEIIQQFKEYNSLEDIFMKLTFET